MRFNMNEKNIYYIFLSTFYFLKILVINILTLQ